MGPSSTLSQQQVIHNQAVLMTHQYGLAHGQQLSNYATGRDSIYGRSPLAPTFAEVLQSARNAPALPIRPHDLSWTLAQPMQQAPQAETKAGQGCFAGVLATCCNIWGCGVETLD